MTPQRKAELAMADLAVHQVCQMLHDMLDVLEDRGIGGLEQIARLRRAIEQCLEKTQHELAEGHSLDADAFQKLVDDTTETIRLLRN